MTISTTVGPAVVLHRLALGVETLDATTGRLTNVTLQVGREVSDGVIRPLPASGPGRYKLNQVPALPQAIRLRIDDPARRVVPRRFDLTLWPSAAIQAVDDTPPSGGYVPVASRMLRPWLLPGPARLLPRGTTALRGRITRAGIPVRWARIVAYVATTVQVGWAHADDRGEFLLVISDSGTAPPVDDTIDVELAVTAASPAPGPTQSDDRLADLVVEAVPRSAAPPGPTDIDNDLVRGLATPARYAQSTAARPAFTVPVGAPFTVPNDIEFVD